MPDIKRVIIEVIVPDEVDEVDVYGEMLIGWRETFREQHVEKYGRDLFADGSITSMPLFPPKLVDIFVK